MSEYYLDHAATTPMHPAVIEAMLPHLGANFGNPSSLHSYGRRAKYALMEARDSIAAYLGCAPKQLFFTSGGTESDNLAIRGLAEALRPAGRTHIITTQIEHHAVLHTCAYLKNQGYDITYLPVDQFGRISAVDLEAALRPDTALVSVMYGNNEVGTLQPIEEIGRICHDHKVYFHVDAVQAVGVISNPLSSMPIDLLSLSAHKINGPKGIGLLYSAPSVAFDPIMFGGAQERSKRPGTEHVAGAVGFAQSVLLHAKNAANAQLLLKRLRQLFVQSLVEEIGEDRFVVNGHPDLYLAHILNISFPGIDKETMLMNLDLAGVAASGGSACTSGALEDSHVLQAMGLPVPLVKSSIRFSFGYGTTEEMIIDVAHKIGTIINRIRKL